jgi:ubiquinone/menaquinone biosynthesis C-methylase UbiE
MNYDNMLTLKSRLGHINAETLLDVGVGRGEFLRFALKSFHSWKRVVGIDTDTESLQAAKNEFRDSPVILILDSALSMPFTHGYFDTITMSNILHHIENIPSLFNEVTRVCKSKGMVIINEMLNENYAELQESYLLYHKFVTDLDNHLGCYHRETYTLKEILSLIKPHSFQLLDYFIHSEESGDTMDQTEIEAMSDRLRKKVAGLKGSDYYYFYENKSREIINRFIKTGIHRPRHATFFLETW